MNVHMSIALLLDPSRILARPGDDARSVAASVAAGPGAADSAQLLAGKRASPPSSAPWPCTPPCSRRAPWCCCCRRRSGRAARSSARCIDAYRALGRPLRAVQETQTAARTGQRLAHRLPARDARRRSARSAASVCWSSTRPPASPTTCIARVRPMLAVSRGRLIALSTPFGQRGWFCEEWHGDGPWKRIRITWRDCPRITPEFIAEETRALGPAWVEQEYECVLHARWKVWFIPISSRRS